MGLVSDVTDTLKGLVGGPARMDPKLFQKAKPLRNPKAETQPLDDGGIVVIVDADAEKRRTMRWIAKVAKWDGQKQFELEEVGAFVWSLCDGNHAVQTISKRLQSQYKMNKIEAEVALGQYLQTLSQRGLITMLVPKK